MRFLTRFLAFVVLFGVLYQAIVMVVNTDGYYRFRIFPVTIPEERIRKLDAFDAYVKQGRVEGLILGSSHARRLRPALFQQRTGLRTFNFSVSSGNIDDELALYRYARSRGCRPKAIYVDIDTFTLNDWPNDVFFTKSFTLRRLIGRPIGLKEAATDLLRHFRNTMRLYYVVYMLSSVQYAIRPGDAPPLIAPDGHGIEPARHWVPGRHWQSDLDTAPILKEWVDDNIRYHSLSRDRCGYLDDLIREAQADGTAVTIWMPPIHPVAEAFLKRATPFGEIQALTRSYVESLRKRYGVAVDDESDPARQRVKPVGWDDFHHFDAATADLMVMEMTSGRRVGPDQDKHSDKE